MNDRDRRFHEEWLGLAQPIEGLVFSVPVLGDSQIAPEVRPELSAAFTAQLGGLGDDERPFIRSCESFFRAFLGYDQAGMLVPRAELPKELSFYAPEGGQEIRPSYALGRGPFSSDDLFAAFEEAPKHNPEETTSGDGQNHKYFALIWDLTQDAPNVAPSAGAYLDLDKAEQDTGTWRYPPTAKFERLLRHVEVPIGLLFNGPELRLLYAPAGQSTAHLTFRVRDLQERAGRPVLAALELLLHSRRAYSAGKDHTLEGLLEASRRRQADVTKALAGQVFEAVETLLAGFEAAGRRDCVGDRPDWLRAALEAADDHFYQGVLSIVLRLVFLLYSEDSSLLPVEQDFYTEHLSVFGLYERLSHDAGTHPESMHHRFGAYGQLLALFRAVYLGVRHDGFEVPPRRGKLFDPNTYPFLEGGLPDWTAAIRLYGHRAEVMPPTIDDGTIYKVLHQLVVFEGQRLSYKALDVEQIGSVYESLMGYHVVRLTSPAVRLGANAVWVEQDQLLRLTPKARKLFLKDDCGLTPAAIKRVESAVKACAALPEELSAHLQKEATGRRSRAQEHSAAAGRLVLQPGEQRRRSASHYTPRSLTERVVRTTLAPLLACLGAERTAEQVLELKICDPAMGSGAFLVAVCRQLADDVVQAWMRSGEAQGLAEVHGDLHLLARRQVAQRCLYGVEKNPVAVELAKLSLWLVTMSRDLPFTFLDHALRHGDSLVGLDFEQMSAFHWAPATRGQTDAALDATLRAYQEVLTESVGQALELRQRILELAAQEDLAAQSEKRRLLEFSQQSLERIRLVADVCVGAFFAAGKDREREAERQRRLTLVQAFLRGDESLGAELAELGQRIKKQHAPFHWMLEFPEIFFEQRPDPLQGGVVNGAAFMDAFVGNPPFAGTAALGAAEGTDYFPWLKATFKGDTGVGGKCDLSAFFFRRARSFLGLHGALGLVATNSISQGDTRQIGLKHILGESEAKIYDATSSMRWPGGANVTISIVHLAVGVAAERAGTSRLDGAQVIAINSRLRSTPERPDPVVLPSSAASAFIGAYVLGMGFTLTPEQRDELVASDLRNSERIFPYLGGEEVNNSPTQTFDRYVISFEDMSLEAAEAWPELMQVVRRDVKPERDASSTAGFRKHWWRYANARVASFKQLRGLERCLVTARVTKHLCFSFQPTDRIFSEQLCVFMLPEWSHFAVLQSRVHEAWARLLSSSFGEGLRYSPSDCVGTFAFPNSDPVLPVSALEEIGRRVYDARVELMAAADYGLTKLYNALKDPEVQDDAVVALRALHEELDRQVVAAYGWNDVAVPAYCAADASAALAFEDAVLDRLYVLNALRAGSQVVAPKGLKKARKSGVAQPRPLAKTKRATVKAAKAGQQ